MNIAVYPHYEEIFDDGNENKNINFFIKDIPTTNIIQVISFFSSCLDYNYNDFSIQNYIFVEFIKPLNQSDQKHISNRINALRDGRDYVVFTNFACLLILQSSLLNYVEGKNSKLSSEDILCVLKSFLLCNSIYSSKSEKLIPGIENTEFKLLGVIMVMDVAQIGFLNNSRDIMEQSFKLNSFDKFLRTDDDIGIYYNEFIIHKGVSELLEIIKFVWNIYFKIFPSGKAFNPGEIKNEISVNKEFRKEHQYLNSISINSDISEKLISKYKEQDLDFKLIREKPLYIIDETQYCIMSNRFFVDKIFQSLLFEYYNFIAINGYTKSFGDFKSYFSYEFTEKFLFWNIIDFMYKKICMDVNQPGDLLKKKDKNNKDYSDYYLRKGNKIVLFECKDRFMDVHAKYSYDFDEIIKDIRIKFTDGVGVDQFLNIFDSLKKNEIPFDLIKNDEIKNLTIIPVIVYTDLAYNARGINYFVNTIFREKLKRTELDFHIEDIIMIHIDTLINNQDLFHNKKVNFINVLERYNRYIKNSIKDLFNKKKSQLNAFENFDTFLNEYLFKERGIKYWEKSYYKKIYKDLYK